MTTQRGPEAHHPGGLLGGAHPGRFEDCQQPACLRQQRDQARRDSEALAALTAKVREAEQRHDAEVRAAALREAADWLTAEYTGPGVDVPIRRAADRLRTLANTTTEPTP